MLIRSNAVKAAYIAIAMLLSLAACDGEPEPENPAPAPPRVEATLEDYAVAGEDCDEVHEALFPVPGSHPGHTICQPRIPGYGFTSSTDADGNCILTLTNVDTRYTIRIQLPKWDAPKGADRRCFDKFLADLKRHEDAHANACREHLPPQLDAAKAVLDGLPVPLDGPCAVEDGQVQLSEAQSNQLDAAVAAALAASQTYQHAGKTLDDAQDAVDADSSLNAPLNCDCP